MLLLRFRPLSGSMVSEHLAFNLINSLDYESFRPLSGSMVSELGGIYFMSKLRRVSVPSRGLRYLNL